MTDPRPDLSADPFNLTRFVAAQEPVYERVVAELSAGAKRSHWMWFVFPQVAGLGRSPMAERYAIASLEEARAYLAHRTLGPRLIACARLLLAVEGRTARAILGTPDDLKLRSSMTLFALAGEGEMAFDIFAAVVDRFYEGRWDEATLAALGREGAL